jgi:hypothetical protein
MSNQTSKKSSNQVNKQMFVSPCKYAMKCTRKECTGAHPSSYAEPTARVTKAVKMCREDLTCTRVDCFFGHKSPACVNFTDEQYMEYCDKYGKNFYAFWECEHPSVPREDALKLYLDAYVPVETREFISHCIAVAEMEWEECKITAEMEECEKAIDILHPPVVVDEYDELIEEAEELEAIMREGDEFFAALEVSN